MFFMPAPNAYAELLEGDTAGFLKELNSLRSEIQKNLGKEDLDHLYKMESWGHFASILGLLTAGAGPNLFSAAAMGLGRSSRWMLMHHIGHRGYDRVPGVPKRYTSRYFAKGWRRFVDWPDWMTPESWKYEHNVLHHSHTGQDKDPDLLERNTLKLQNSKLPKPLRYAIMLALGTAWKPIYYAPSNVHALHRKNAKGVAGDFLLDKDEILELIFDMYLPYILLQFVILPALYLPAGPWGVFSAFTNSLMAEIFSNFHTFLVVGPNHTGEDIWRFDHGPRNLAERMLHQVIGSVNYRTGGDLNDFLHFWLNYQIEHHIWPDIPMLKYQQYQPQVKALCEKYGIPYLEEDVWTRFKKMLAVTTGESKMLQARLPDTARAHYPDLVNTHA
jgi:fatty acid desaturase